MRFNGPLMIQNIEYGFALGLNLTNLLTYIILLFAIFAQGFTDMFVHLHLDLISATFLTLLND